MEYSNLFVCVMGMCTVFFGLICLIVLTMIMGAVCSRGLSTTETVAAPAIPAAAEPNREELVAAVSAAIAEELGADISGIRILSMKRV